MRDFSGEELWAEIGLELMRLRQQLSCPRDLRDLGPSNPELRPVLIDVVHRYTRGRCADFAVALATANSSFRLAGFYAGEALVHAFVTDREKRCVEVSGAWTMREMRALCASDGPFSLRYPSLEQVLAEIRENEAAGADFDPPEVVLTVAGGLPHLRDVVPEEFAAPDPEAALAMLAAIKEGRYAELPTAASGVRVP